MSDSNPIIVAVDVDEVLATFLESLVVFHNEQYNTALKFSDFHSYHFCDVWGGTNDEARAKVDAYFESSYFQDLPRVAGSESAMKELKDTGRFEFHIVTSRQTHLEPLTRGWLERHFPNVFTSVHHGNHYGEGVKKEKYDICKDIGATILIDDNWRYIKQVCDNGMTGIMLNLNDTYNWSRPTEVPSNCVLAHDWDRVKQYLLSLIE